MRRGLISHARLELPDAVLDARLARVRAAMAEARLDALVLYSNNTRAAGVSWLTGFVPYWSEALLVLVREAPPILVVALTYRVKGWIERTSRVADVIHGPRIGREAARVIAGAKADAVVAVPGLDHLPAGIADDLRSGGPRLVLTDASSMFAPLRGQADATEIALATKAAWIAQRALACAELASSGGESLNAIIAATEGEGRRLGAEEVYIAAAPDLARDPRWRLCRLCRVAGRGLPGRAAARALDGIANPGTNSDPFPRIGLGPGKIADRRSRGAGRRARLARPGGGSRKPPRPPRALLVGAKQPRPYHTDLRQFASSPASRCCARAWPWRSWPRRRTAC